MAQVIKKRIVKIVLWVVLSLFLLLAGIIGAFQFAAVQTSFVNSLARELSEITGFEISFEKVDIRWFDKVNVRGLKVIDPEGNRLFYTKSAKIDYQLRSLIDKENRQLDEIIVNDAGLYFTNINVRDPAGSHSSLNINILIKRIRSLIRKQSSGRKLFSIDKVQLNNASLTYYQNDSSKQMHAGLDYKHFSIENIYGDFNNLQSMSDTLLVNIESLSAQEYLSGLKLYSLKSDFHLSKTTMKFEGLSLETGRSYITDTIIFNFETTQDLSDFVDKVTISASLKNTTFNSQDLALFAPAMKKYQDSYKINGEFVGKVKDFILSNASVEIGDGTFLYGKIRMSGLPNFQETFIDFDLEHSILNIADTKKYLKTKTYNRLRPFNNINFEASFLGFPNDFVTKGTFYTNLGKIESDINLKLADEVNESLYRGKLTMYDFDAGGYTGNNLLETVTLNGEIEGKGFTIEAADFQLNGKVQHIGVYGYDYKNIVTNARFTKSFFEGFLEINDPNVKMTTNGSIDLRDGINFFNLNAQIDSVNFKPLNITDEDLFLSTFVRTDATGLEIDDVEGQAFLLDTYVKYQDKSLVLDSLTLISKKDGDNRILNLSTNLVSFKANGNFDYTQLYGDLTRLWHEYKLNIKNNKDSLRYYYANKMVENVKDYHLDYVVNFKDFNPFLEVFVPDLFVEPKTSLSGSFTSGYTSIFSLNSKPDTIRYKNHQFYNNDLQLNISKIADSTNVLAMAYLSSENQMISGIETQNMLIDAIWDNRHIGFEVDIDQLNYNNHAWLLGEVDFLTDSTQIHLKPSDIQILDKKWEIEADNRVVISNYDIKVENLSVFNNTQTIAVSGMLSKNPEEALTASINNIKLENLNTILNENLSGIINGYVNIKDYYNRTAIENEITVDQFMIDDFLVGNLQGSNIWDNEKQLFNLDLVVNRNDVAVLDVHGTMAPGQGKEALDVIADLNQTNLKILEPFFDNIFSDIKGTASGTVKITGALNRPIFNGLGTIQDGQTKVNYLNTVYGFKGSFYLEEDAIGFRNIALTDQRNHHANLYGKISHDNFRDMFMDVKGDFENFMLLNTSNDDNDLFYGTGIGSGNIRFYGDINQMNIIASATTAKETKIFIPLNGSDNIQQEEYINFVDLNDTTNNNTASIIDKVDLEGLKLDFDLNITPDAYAEIIFDIKSGDIIRGRGNGVIKLQIDTQGEFNMFGDYTIQEGGYNFTLYNVINKEFEILPNSSISWYGDPYQGVLDINATYNQLASFLPILVTQETDTIYQESVELRRKYPVKVFLDIEGPLLSPSVDFDITANNLPRNIQLANGEVKDLEFEFMAFKNKIDEQELKRQVFSLIVLRKFSPYQSFNTGGTITSSVSELFSNQLSYWITQVDENLEIDVDLGKLDDEAFNTFQLRLSYTFLDGRLRITRDGGFTNQENKADISSIAGDWTLEYLLTPDGKFKVKMYNRTNYNPINPNQESQNTITTGFSVIHTQSFDELKDLFIKTRKKGRKEDNDEENNSDTQNSVRRQEAIRDEYEDG